MDVEITATFGATAVVVPMPAGIGICENHVAEADMVMSSGLAYGMHV